MLEVFGYHAIAAAAYGLFLAMLLRLTRSAYLSFRRRKSGFGVVFNSVTGKPESMAIVSLQTLGGKTFRTAPTDKEGRYNLVAPKGDYILEVRKNGFSFPSKILSKKNNDSAFQNILCVKHIIVTDHGSITVNIPIDPKNTTRRISLFKRYILRNKAIQDFFSFTSPFLALLIAYILREFWVVWILLGFYFTALVVRFLDFKPPSPPYGTVRDAETGEPLDRVMVRIFEQKYGKLLETQVTSGKGRYAFVVKKGQYRLLVQKTGYKSVIINFPDIKDDYHLLAKDAILHKRDG
ncbi:MAG: carboxypeptidase-like regulatory domain-containing protein [Patescibacteria group bacterium]|nr:carboxypeptidase-like regulatory domain-containing protein [Patescibacteria group bacterium]